MEQNVFRKYWLVVVDVIIMLVALWMVFVYAPTELTMGNVQRIFYFHVPVDWVAFLSTTLMLLTGMLWARPAWGVYWVWEPRLTTALVLWFIYVAYLLIRSYAGEEARGARFAAVVGIVGFIDVPIVALSIVLWRVQHPAPLVFESGGRTSSMMATLMVSLTAFTILYAILLRVRFKLRKAEHALKTIEQE
jgi:heme exporter protein C